MSRQFKDVVISVIRPPLIVVGFIAKTIYAVFFGRADKRLARKYQDQLEAEIRQELAFLFEKYEARIIPNMGDRFPPPFNYAIVTVEAGELLFRFVRGRGELDVQVTSKSHLNKWHDISLVVGAIENPDEMQNRSFTSLSDAAFLLKPNIRRIQEAFSGANYIELQKHLTNVEQFARAVTKQLENEINRRLYS